MKNLSLDELIEQLDFGLKCYSCQLIRHFEMKRVFDEAKQKPDFKLADLRSLLRCHQCGTTNVVLCSKWKSASASQVNLQLWEAVL